ncbi:MAG: 16S rRNA (guanine(966)-N(2))-methyltransferase RsmD [Bacteroidales bacterium]
MRIISGSHRGRRLFPPSGLPVRPTTDLAKESLFNILWNYVDLEDLRVLDLFAGTGNITYEFASRGCYEIVAVELNKRCTDYIKNTSLALEFRNIRVIRADVFQFLKHRALPFHIIFADPPYDLKDSVNLPDLIFAGKWLEKDGFLIIEHPREINYTGHPNFMENRKYGKVNFSFFRNL